MEFRVLLSLRELTQCDIGSFSTWNIIIYIAYVFMRSKLWGNVERITEQ